MFVGIDPSFTRTGIGLLSKQQGFPTLSFKHSGRVLDVERTKRARGNFALDVCLHNAELVAEDCEEQIMTWYSECEEKIIPVIEYPVLATPAGAYLGLIQPKIHTAFRRLFDLGVIDEYIMIPSTAIISFFKNKRLSKAEIVEWVKEKMHVTRRINHYEASALIIGYIGHMIKNKKYKKSYYIIKYK